MSIKYRYNRQLKDNSRKLRADMTKEERRLWFDFLCRQEIKFYRQKIIGRYIVDFYCPQKKVVIEIDGSQHFDTAGVETDRTRDEYLNGLGITVLRYNNREVNTNFDGDCSDIRNKLGLP